MATVASRHDLSRFRLGSHAIHHPASAIYDRRRRVVMKMLPVMQRIWLQMPDRSGVSRWSRACSGGVFDTTRYVQGIDRFIPVDMYIPGCPPRPEQLIRAVIDLQEKIQRTGTINAREFINRDEPEVRSV